MSEHSRSIAFYEYKKSYGDKNWCLHALLANKKLYSKSKVFKIAFQFVKQIHQCSCIFSLQKVFFSNMENSKKISNSNKCKLS